MNKDHFKCVVLPEIEYGKKEDLEKPIKTHEVVFDRRHEIESGTHYFAQSSQSGRKYSVVDSYTLMRSSGLDLKLLKESFDYWEAMLIMPNGELDMSVCIRAQDPQKLAGLIIASEKQELLPVNHQIK